MTFRRQMVSARKAFDANYAELTGAGNLSRYDGSAKGQAGQGIVVWRMSRLREGFFHGNKART
jgi:hypothetical protein